ncbi:MAG: YraN family protein [Lentisphaeria bacterium]|nr:YraN family protein [Lentisphaeria bacterium]
MNSFAAARRARQALGRRGESLAAAVLRDRGYEIWARNWRTRAGELDIVGWDGRELHFVEVKTLHRRAGFTPAGNLSPRQRRRNYNAAKVYLALMGGPGFTSRFDLIEIEYSSGGKLLELRIDPDYLPELPPQDVRKNEVPVIPGDDGANLPWWSRLWRKLDLLPCPVCGTGPGRGAGFICQACLAKLAPIGSARRCPGCGGELDGVLALCSRCAADQVKVLWQGNVALFEHRGLGRTLIHKFKYGGRPELARPFGRLGADALREAGFSPDLVTAVPMHWTRRLLRSYDQAALFGGAVAGFLHVPFRAVLERTRMVRRQATLGRTARLKNLRGAFRCSSPGLVSGKKILLVDDVYTTGSTMTAATRELMKSGASAVYLLTISRRQVLCGKNVKKRTRIVKTESFEV